MKSIALTIACSALCWSVGFAHMGMTYPPPRSTANSQTTGPCGQVGQLGTGTITELTPGQTLHVVLNAANHPGHNYRIALSQDGSDTYDCILIDHIPQAATSFSTLHIPVTIPDVDCANCAIQAIMVEPGSTTCCKFGTNCGTTWYACANVKIKGKTKRNQLQCSQPCTWAYRDEKPGTYTYEQTNAYWISSGTNYTLNITGGYVKPTCQNVTKSTCPKTNTDTSSASKDSNASLSNGGKMTAGGVIGIVVVILVILGIGVTWFVSLKNRKNENQKVSPIIANNVESPQAIVSTTDEGDGNAGTYVRPQVPPPPPQRFKA